MLSLIENNIAYHTTETTGMNGERNIRNLSEGCQIDLITHTEHLFEFFKIERRKCPHQCSVLSEINNNNNTFLPAPLDFGHELRFKSFAIQNFI